MEVICMSIMELIERGKRARKQKARKQFLQNVALGAAVGVTVGAVAGVLLAPKSGKETREDVVKAVKKLPDKAKEGIETVKEKIEEVKSGKSELVLKQWEGRPYHSTPKKLFIFDAKDDVEVSKLTKTADGFFVNDTKKVEPEDLAKNDGLSLQDFEDWFKVFPTEPMALIHLTGFRYENN